MSALVAGAIVGGAVLVAAVAGLLVNYAFSKSLEDYEEQLRSEKRNKRS